MPEIARHLITTADERTWKFDRPVIFLGEWCRAYDRKEIWQDMNAIIAAPYGLGKARKDADRAEARILEEKVFPILCDVLNQYHGTHHDLRFWQIVLGHWFRRYVDVILNRVRTLEKCLHTYQLSGVTACTDEDYSLAPLSTYTALSAFNDDIWNNALCVRILRLMGGAGCPVEVIAGGEFKGGLGASMATNASPMQKVWKWSYRQVRNLIELFSRESDALIINSGLPRIEEIKLQLALRQMPQLWTSPQFEIVASPSHTLRRSLSDQLTDGVSEGLLGILRLLVFELLPVCYLEGFVELEENVQQLPWPKTPKLIFTSNNFDTDELFKLWTATKVEAGHKYVVGQHGNSYATHRYHCPATIEEVTADKFLTWGWEGGLPQHTSAFIFKMAGRKPGVYNRNGGLLLIETIMDLRINTWDVAAEFNVYFEDQKSFVAELSGVPRRNLTVRLHAAWRRLKGGEAYRWHEFDPDINIDWGASAIGALISQSRLVVHSYDSTGILETLSQNIPTLAFWQNELDHLQDSARPYYQLLVDAGIVHLTPETAAAKVNAIWDDVDGWWSQRSVQEARKKFCDRFAKAERHPVQEIKRLLVS